MKGYPLWAVAEDQRNSMVDPLLNEHRIKAGLKIINRTQSKYFLPRIFKKGEIILLLSDQDAGRHGVFVPFFGSLTSTPAGAAVCALRYGAPLLYVNTIYHQGKYDFVFERLPMPADINYSARTIRLVTAQHVARLEQDIRRFPEQWFWVHRRWKTPPEKAERRG